MAGSRTRLALSLVAALILSGGSAGAQTPAELAQGRKLFAEALADEEQQRFAAALAKYRQVQQIRDTAPVRYRIASSLEGLGKIVQALEAYRATVQLGQHNDKDADVVKAAQAREGALASRVGHLALRISQTSPPDTEVTVDGAPVPRAELTDVAVDPGAHLVVATAPGARTFRAELRLSEGGRVEIPIALEPVSAAEPQSTPDTGRPEAGGSSLKTIGIVTAGVGGALAIGGAVFLILRSSAISDLNSSCPNGVCPASRQSELTDTRERALVQGPIGIALLAASAVAIGTAVTLFTLAPSEKKAAMRIMPIPLPQGGMLGIHEVF